MPTTPPASLTVAELIQEILEDPTLQQPGVAPHSVEHTQMFGRILKHARGKRSFTKLAQTARVSPSIYQGWEEGTHLPRPYTLKRLLLKLPEREQALLIVGYIFPQQTVAYLGRPHAAKT